MYRKCTWCRIRYLLSFEKHYKDRIANENMRKIYLFSLVLDHFLDFFFVGIMFLKYVRFGSMSEIYERLCWLLQGSEICTDSRTSSKGRLHIAFCICCKKEHPLFDITSVRRKKSFLSLGICEESLTFNVTLNTYFASMNLDERFSFSFSNEF